VQRPAADDCPRLVTPAKAHGVKIAQGGDVQIGRDRDDRYDSDRRRRYYSDTTVGVGPRGVTVGPRQRCRMVTTTVERPQDHAQGAPLRLNGEQHRRCRLLPSGSCSSALAFLRRGTGNISLLAEPLRLLL